MRKKWWMHSIQLTGINSRLTLTKQLILKGFPCQKNERRKKKDIWMINPEASSHQNAIPEDNPYHLSPATVAVQLAGYRFPPWEAVFNLFCGRFLQCLASEGTDTPQLDEQGDLRASGVSPVTGEASFHHLPPCSLNKHQSSGDLSEVHHWQRDGN